MNKNGITVGLAIENYIIANYGVLTPTTIRLYESMLSNPWYYKDLRYKTVEELTNFDVQLAVNKLKSCHELSNRTIRQAMTLFDAAIKFYNKDIVFNYRCPSEICMEV